MEDLLAAELENMATNATDSHPSPSESLPDSTIERWQRLFDCPSAHEASTLLERHRTDLTRIRVTDEHWAIVRTDKEAEGYDREAYEYSLGREREKAKKDLATPKGSTPTGERGAKSRKSYFILMLGGPLDTAGKVQQAAGLDELPTVLAGDAAGGEANFVRVDAVAKAAIQSWLERDRSSFQPTFVRISKAEKDLSPDSLYPTLGLESTLPHHRATSRQASFSPAQDEYPVWYFFYGTLADPERLTSLLSLSEPPVLRPASVKGGIVKMWAGKYKALVDGLEDAETRGWAYLVRCREDEDALGFYETGNYEVVRCEVRMRDGGEVVRGLTYRFVGGL